MASTFIFISLLLFSLSNAYIPPLPVVDTRQYIVQNMNFSDYVVEEGELIEIPLGKMFSGQLLQFDVSTEIIPNSTYRINGSLVTEHLQYDEKFNFCTLLKPFYSFSQDFLEQEYRFTMLNKDPFKRTTVMIENYDHSESSIFFLSSSLIFYKYDVTSVSSQYTTQKGKVNLDPEAANSECYDLTFINDTQNNRQFFLLFCKSIYFYQNLDHTFGSYVEYQTILINGTELNEKTQIYYIYHDFKRVAFDKQSGVRYIGLNQSHGSNLALFTGIGYQFEDEYDQDPDNWQHLIFSINLTVYDELRDTGFKKYPISKIEEFDQFLQIQHYVIFDDQYRKRQTYDQLLIRPDLKIMAYLIDDMIIMCPLIPSSHNYTRIDCSIQSEAELINQTNGVSLYKHQQDPNYFYVTISYPPGVMEMDISDPYNVKAKLIYRPPKDLDTNIGLDQITTNENFIIHHMYNFETQREFFRAYYRKGLRYEQTKYDYILPQQSKTSYFTFPNFYINVLWTRDEKMVNLTGLFDYKLALIGIDHDKFFQEFAQQSYLITLLVKNDLQQKQFKMKATLVHKDFKGITVRNPSHLTEPVEIFYSCGSNNFYYTTTDFFIGPYFNQRIEPISDNCEDGSCYFELMNEGTNIEYDSQLTDHRLFNESCNLNFLFPDVEHFTSEKEPITLVCIYEDTKTHFSYITSYSLIKETNETIKTGEIIIPEIQFLYLGSDKNERTLFGIAKKSLSNKWVRKSYEVHFFQIHKKIIWKSFRKLEAIISENERIFHFSFSPVNNQGVILTNDEKGTQKMLVYEIDFQQSNFSIVIQQQFKLNKESIKINKALIYNQQLIYIFMTENKVNQSLTIFEVYNKTGTREKVMVQILKVNLLRNTEKVDYDLFDNYLVAYVNQSQIIVFLIQSKIYLQYQMTLPFYQEYKNYTFMMNGMGYPIRSSYEGFLSILMKDVLKEQYKIFIFCLFSTQHDSFVLEEDFTQFFKGSTYQNINLNGNSLLNLNNSLALIRNDRIQLHNVVYYNYLYLNPDQGRLLELTEKCSQFKSRTDSQAQLIDPQRILAEFKLRSFVYDSSNDSQESPFINVRIYSSNQGLAITPVSSLERSITYYDEVGTFSNQTILLEDLIEGFSLDYEFNCTYYSSEEGDIDTCEEAIGDGTKSNPFIFYIEFVTYNRTVFKSIVLDDYFLVFDTSGYYHFLKLQGTKDDLSRLNGSALDVIESQETIKQFGCVIDHYIDIIFIEKKDGISFYFAFYQCLLNHSLTFQVAQLEVKNFDKMNRTNILKVTVYKSPIYIPYQMIDMDRSNIRWLDGENKNEFQVILASTYEIPSAFTNIFYAINVTINRKEEKFVPYQVGWASSVSEGQNTFNVTRILRIDGANMVILVDEDEGGYIYDLELLRIIKKFNLIEDDKYNDQSSKVYGSLKVFSVAAQWPNTIHFLTNFGIFIYMFDLDLQDRDQIFPDYQRALANPRLIIVRQYFSSFNIEIAANQYGYAFLTRTQTSRYTYDVYLGAVAFYSNMNSKILKMIRIGENLNCKCLRESPNLANDLEDQLAVIFICNTQLYIVQVCMRPHLEVIFDQYKDDAISYDPNTITYYHKALDVNAFNISIIASNNYNYSDAQNKVQLNLTYYFVDKLEMQQDQIYWMASIVFIGFVFIILGLNHGKKAQSNDNDRLQHQGSQINLSRNSDMFLKSLSASEIRRFNDFKEIKEVDSIQDSADFAPNKEPQFLIDLSKFNNDLRSKDKSSKSMWQKRKLTKITEEEYKVLDADDSEFEIQMKNQGNKLERSNISYRSFIDQPSGSINRKRKPEQLPHFALSEDLPQLLNSGSSKYQEKDKESIETIFSRKTSNSFVIKPMKKKAKK